jgi:hypothetical protein
LKSLWRDTVSSNSHRKDSKEKRITKLRKRDTANASKSMY